MTAQVIYLDVFLYKVYCVNYVYYVYTSVVPVNMLQDYTPGCYYWS